jgi:tetratricopeptide (TPR) repeat protein
MNARMLSRADFGPMGSNASMALPGARRLACLVLCVGVSACAKTTPKTIATPPGPTPTERLAEADRLVRAGCLDCLLDAYHRYDALRAIPTAATPATLGAIRAAGLIALRQRELGMVDEGYIETAKALAASTPDLPAWVSGTLDIANLLGGAIGGISRPATTDLDLERMRTLRTNGAAYTKLLQDFSEVDELSAYTWLVFKCGSTDARAMATPDIFAAVSTFRDTPLIAFEQATCRTIDTARISALAAAEPRFVETSYLLGLREVARRKLDEADGEFAKAYAWRPRWPSLTLSMGNVAMTAEEFERAERLYGETLAADPGSSDARLGRVKALTYLGKAVEAIAVTDEMLADRWHLGDARYWRALNELQIERFDAAWTDVEEAAKLLINSDVPKLAGIIAYRRHELDVSRGRFQLTRERNSNDCEAAFYLGVVLAEQRTWDRTAAVSREAVACLQSAEEEAVRDIATIRESADPAERKTKQIARREQLIANGKRMMATSWFNTAVAYYNLSQKAEARQFAEKVVGDEQFAERAKEILSRLAK